MPKIEIRELDLTIAGNNAADTDVVYIPGFVDAEQDSLFDNGEYIGLQPHVPTLITSMSQFKTLCGTRGARFDRDQLYTDLIEVKKDGSYSGFASNAVPYSKTMFVKDTIDPSYVMAKELIQAGLSVIYERINDDADYVKVASEPKDWKNSYSRYYTDKKIFLPISSNTPPSLFTHLVSGDEAPIDTDNVTYKFYTMKVDENLQQVYTEKDRSTVVDDAIGIVTSECFVRASNAVKYYKFNPVVEEVSPIFELDKYYALIATKVTSKNAPDDWSTGTYYKQTETGDFDKVNIASDTYSSGKYYTLENTILTAEPIDWADPQVRYYTKDENNYKLVKFNVGPIFEANKYYTAEINTNSYTLLDAEPEYWNPETCFTAELIPDIWKQDNKIIIPASFATDYINYAEESKTIISIKTADTTPAFEGNIYEHSDFINIKTMYSALSVAYDTSREKGLADMGWTSIKYLTSGGYPTYEYNNNEIVSKMINLAKYRGDCVAFIDHTDNANRTTNMNSSNSVYATVLADDSLRDDGEFATMFTPYMNHNRVTSDSDSDTNGSESAITMSGTFSYLLALADSIKTNANWLAVAGAARGVVPNLQKVGCTTPITNGAADLMQPRDRVAVNAITNIAPYGYTIWGNRTLKNNGEEGNLTATSFLNIRNLISDIKKLCYATCKQLTFEPNNDILWVNIKSKLQPTLDRMTSGYGISGYKIVRDNTREEASEKATLCFKVLLYPVYAVEDFYITVVLTDDEVAVE